MNNINRNPFTLIEILLVVTIIAIILGISLVTLQNARDQARFGRWLAFSANIKAEPGLVAYYNFQEYDPYSLKNQAFCVDIPQYDQRKVDAAICNAKWSRGRWKNKGALWMNGVNSYAMIGANNKIKSLPKEFAVELWIYPITLENCTIFQSNAIIYNPVTTPANAPKGITQKFDPVNSSMFTIALNGKKLIISYAANISFATNPSNRQGDNGYAWGTFITTTDVTTQSITMGGNFKINQWQHIVISYSSYTQKIQLFLNGNLVDDYAETRPVIYLFEKSYIGGSESSGDSFNGIIDEVGIYSRAFTPYDVKAHYTMGTPR